MAGPKMCSVPLGAPGFANTRADEMLSNSDDVVIVGDSMLSNSDDVVFVGDSRHGYGSAPSTQHNLPQHIPVPSASSRGEKVSDSEDVLIVGHTGRGYDACVDLPHERADCGLHVFHRASPGMLAPEAVQANAQSCQHCFCYICDRAASICIYWRKASHCCAYRGNVSWDVERSKHITKLMEHPDTLHTTGNLAAFVYCQGKQAKSELMLRELLDVQRRVLGPKHPRTLATARKLSICPRMSCTSCGETDEDGAIFDSADGRCFRCCNRTSAAGTGNVVRLAAGSHGRLSGLVSRPDLNRTTCKVIRFDEAMVRYTVRLADGSRISVKPENLTPAVVASRAAEATPTSKMKRAANIAELGVAGRNDFDSSTRRRR